MFLIPNMEKLQVTLAHQRTRKNKEVNQALRKMIMKTKMSLVLKEENMRDKMALMKLIMMKKKVAFNS